MAFPTIPTLASSRLQFAVQANATAARTFPSLTSLAKNAGDLLIAVIYGYQSNVTSGMFGSWGAGFTEFLDAKTTLQQGIGAAYKWSDGTETGTFTCTQTSAVTGHAAMGLMSIPGAHHSTPPEGGSYADGTTAAADPASLNPANWDAEETLWISIAGSGETGTGGAFNGVSTTPPTNYGDAAVTSISSDVVGGVNMGVAFRQLNAASEDVGTWSVDVSNARNAAAVIAVRPEPELVSLVQFGAMPMMVPPQAIQDRSRW